MKVSVIIIAATLQVKELLLRQLHLVMEMAIPRQLTNRGRVLIKNKHYPIIGTVCMDMIMINIDENVDEIKVGDEVIMFGRGNTTNLPLQEISSLCNTIDYEILCGMQSQRIIRSYLPNPSFA